MEHFSYLFFSFLSLFSSSAPFLLSLQRLFTSLLLNSSPKSAGDMNVRRRERWVLADQSEASVSSMVQEMPHCCQFMTWGERRRGGGEKDVFWRQFHEKDPVMLLTAPRLGSHIGFSF